MLVIKPACCEALRGRDRTALVSLVCCAAGGDRDSKFQILNKSSHCMISSLEQRGDSRAQNHSGDGRSPWRFPTTLLPIEEYCLVRFLNGSLDRVPAPSLGKLFHSHS